MDHVVEPARRSLVGPFPVPPSKSEHQRALALAALSEKPVRIESTAAGRPGQDVQALAASLQRVGHWTAGAWGASRKRLRLDLREGATGFRYAIAMATLRPAGARTLITGRPALLRRDHRTLLRALRGLGGHVLRRRSGAVRVIAGALRGGRVTIDASVSSQFATTLMLLAPRIGGLEIQLRGRAASKPYLHVSADLLQRFSVPVERLDFGRVGGTIRVSAGEPQAERIELAPDASSAAVWWSAVALCGGEVVIPGLAAASGQADMAAPGLLARMGAEVDTDLRGDVRLRSAGRRLKGLGAVDLRDAPDLVFLMGCLAATAEGTTVLSGVSATRAKESDRVAVLVRGLQNLGGDVRIDADDSILIRGRELRGGVVNVAGDHRAAMAFGILGLRVPGLSLTGRVREVEKSHPDFLGQLAALGTG